MIELSKSIWICIGLLAYYLVFQVFSDFVRAGMQTNSPSKVIANLRTKYKVNIRTFQKNNNLYGFAWIKSIWLNENLLEDIIQRKKALYFTFHHEYYHLRHNHKLKVLLMRFTVSLIPLLLSFTYWWVFAVVFIGSAVMIQYVSKTFEDKANEYARSMMLKENIKGTRKVVKKYKK